MKIKHSTRSLFQFTIKHKQNYDRIQLNREKPQVERVFNKNGGIRHDNLLKHLLRCGECGSRFTSAMCRYGRSYKCTGKDAEAENWIAAERSEYERKCEENSKVIDTLKNEIAGLNRRRTSLLKYEDRVEICNPGRFPTGVTPENIKTLHSSKPRNLHIAQVMYKAAYLEGWGTGIKRMIDVCKAHNLPEPFYQIWADGTIVLTFQRPKTAKNGETNGETNGKWESLTERQNSIIQCLQKNGTHTSRTLSILLDISQRTVEREISFLRNNGFIDKEGSTKNGTWRVLK